MKSQQRISSSLTNSLTDFTEELALTKSALTAEAYSYDTEAFLLWLYENGVKSPGRIRASHITAYLTSCKQAGKSDATVNRYYMSIRAFCRFLRESGAADADVSMDVRAPRFTPKTPYVPSREQVGVLLRLPQTDSEEGARDKAILELLYSSGLRATELCNLELDDVREEGLLVRCGKRGKGRTVPITPHALESIRTYVERFRGTEPGYLFITTMGCGMRRQLLSKIVGKYGKKAGLKAITAHTLRHACATHLLEKGADLRLIQEVLGHTSISSTQRYTHLTSCKIKEMFNNYHPRSQDDKNT